MTALSRPVAASTIARFLGSPLNGSDSEVTRIATATDRSLAGALVFVTEKAAGTIDCAAIDASLVLAPLTIADQLKAAHVVVANPRLAFARVVKEFVQVPQSHGVDASAVVSTDAKLGRRVHIGARVVISGSVTIGDDTCVMPGVVISGPVLIGQRCIIKSNSVIGQEGFGVEFDADGSLVRIPQVGGVVLEDDVEIGALNTVASGTIEPTRVRAMVKCDDHVHIAHNCDIGERAILTACTELSGSVVIGADVWLGPNCSILNKVTIGAGSLVGLGAVVTKDVVGGVVVAGNPARVIRHR